MPPSRTEVLNRLRAAAPQLRALRVERLFLFGSVARDQAKVESDVDMLVDPADDRFTLFDLANVQLELEQLLGCSVELHDYGGYERLPAVRARIGADLIQVL